MTDQQLIALAFVGIVVWAAIRLLKADSEQVTGIAAVGLYISACLASIYGLVKFVRWAWYHGR
jgi:ABC-type siderophore export system fused ATPase/permease subunit